MKNLLYLVGILFGGFALYKLLGRLGGSAAAPGAPSIAPSTVARFENITAGQTVPVNRTVAARTDDTAAIIGASLGAVKSLVGIGTDVAKLFSSNATTRASDPNSFDFSKVMFSGVTNDPFTWSFNGSTPAVDYTPPTSYDSWGLPASPEFAYA